MLRSQRVLLGRSKRWSSEVLFMDEIAETLQKVVA